VTTVALLHPGIMGVTIGATAKAVGAAVLWASAERGAPTRNRTEAAGFEERDDLAAALAEAELILSVCLAHAALDLVCSVVGHGFTGFYVDGNAVSPASAQAISARFVDGDIIGPPARHPIRTASPVNPPRW